MAKGVKEAGDSRGANGNKAAIKECVEDLKIMAGMYLRGEVEVGVLFVMLTLLQMRVRHAVSGCEDFQTWERIARTMRAGEVGVRKEK